METQSSDKVSSARIQRDDFKALTRMIFGKGKSDNVKTSDVESSPLFLHFGVLQV